MVPPDRLDRRGLLGQQGLPVHKDLLVRKDQRVIPAQPERLEQQARPVLRDQLALWGQWDLKVLKGRRVTRGPPARQEPLARLVLQALLDQWG